MFSSNLGPNSTNSVSFLITSVLNCASDRLAISVLFSYIFSGALICSFIWVIFLSWNACYVKGQSLRCPPGWGNAGPWAVKLDVGEGLRGGGSSGACSTLCQISVTPSATHNQIGPLWCWLPSKWACARLRPLWVSPTTSPVRLGVSPAAASTPTGVFNQRFEALFPRAGALGYVVCLAPSNSSRFICARVWGRGVLPAALPAPFSATLSPALWVYLCKCGASGSASARTACPVRPTLRQSWSRHGHASPLRPGARLHPSYLSGCMFLFYLFGVGLPCHSIFCQLWLCEEGQCVYICRHLGSLVGTFFFHFISYD